MRAVKPVQKVVCPDPSHKQWKLQYDHGSRESTRYSFIRYVSNRPCSFDHISTWSWQRLSALSLSSPKLFPAPALVHSARPCAQQRWCPSYLIPGKEKSSLVIPVKMWIKRIAGVILRCWRLPQRQVFQDVTRVVFNTELQAAAVSSVSNFHTVWCYYSSFLHLSFLPPPSVIGGFQSFGRFAVIWSSGAVGSRCGDKKRQGWKDWEKRRLVWPRMERAASRKSIKQTLMHLGYRRFYNKAFWGPVAL